VGLNPCFLKPHTNLQQHAIDEQSTHFETVMGDEKLSGPQIMPYDMDECMLSVGILTYNHAPFIAECLETVLNQKTAFGFEVVIGDDCSKDGTLNILNGYAERFPGRITILTSATNIGVYANGRRVVEACKGKYVAMLDGDDKWLFDGKLMAQVAELEAAPDCAGCFHDALIRSDRPIQSQSHGFDYGNYKTYSQFNQYNRRFYPWDVLERNIVPTSSLVFRNTETLLDEMVLFEDHRRSLDWIYHLLLIQNSYFMYINEPWSMYNDHAGGITKTVPRHLFILTIISGLKRLIRHEYYKNIIHHVYSSIAREYLNLFFVQVDAPRRTRLAIVLRYLLYAMLGVMTRCRGLIAMVFRRASQKDERF
jgi:glycosyltransferase involved in cell wall biosynthesis